MRLILRFTVIVVVVMQLLIATSPVEASHDIGKAPWVLAFDSNAGFYSTRVQRPRTAITVCKPPTAASTWLAPVLNHWNRAAGWAVFVAVSSGCKVRFDTHGLTTCTGANACTTPLPYPPTKPGNYWFTSCVIYYTPGSLYPAAAVHELGHCLGFVDAVTNATLVKYRSVEGPSVHQCNAPTSPWYSAYRGIMSHCVFPTVPLGAQDRLSLQKAGIRPSTCIYPAYPCAH